MENKVIIIAGAANEIGRTLSFALSKEGAKLTLTDRSKDRLDELSKELPNALSIKTDPTDSSQIQKAVSETVEKWKRVDALVYNEWVNELCPFIELNEEKWDRIINTNLRGAFYFARAVVPTMRAQKEGQIINVVSLAGYSGSSLQEVPFCTSQAALMGFTRCLARELGGSKIRVNAVALDYGSLDPKFEVYPQESITKLRAMMAIGRLGKPEDVVGPILFLLSPDSGFITGEILGVGGGLYMR